MLVLLVEKVVDLIILLMLLMFICKVNSFVRLTSSENFRTDLCGSIYWSDKSHCYSLWNFLGVQRQAITLLDTKDLEICVMSLVHCKPLLDIRTRTSGSRSVQLMFPRIMDWFLFFFFFFTSILLYDSVSCGVFFHRSIIVFS